MKKLFLINYENKIKLKTKQIQIQSKNYNNNLNSSSSSPTTSISLVSNSLDPSTTSNPTSNSSSIPLNSSSNSSSPSTIEIIKDEGSIQQSINSISSTSIVSMILDKEQKRGDFLMKHFEKCDATNCGPGAPSGHIPRKLNKIMPENFHIDKNTANLPFSFAQNTDNYIPFPTKPLQDVGWNDSPPKQISKFSKTPIPTLNKSPQSARKSLLRDTIKNYIIQDIPSIQTYNRSENSISVENISAPMDEYTTPKSLTNQLKELWIQQIIEFNTFRQQMNNSDLIELSHTNSQNINFLFEYLYYLIFGKENYAPSISIKSPKSTKIQSSKKLFERSPRLKQNDNETDFKKILLKDISSLLLFLKQVDPESLPFENIELASNNFKKNIRNYSNDSITRLSKPFTKLIRWCIFMNKLCSIILYPSSKVNNSGSTNHDQNCTNLINEQDKSIEEQNELENTKKIKKEMVDVEIFEPQQDYQIDDNISKNEMSDDWEHQMKVNRSSKELNCLEIIDI